MADLLRYHFITYPIFALILLAVVLIALTAQRFHLFHRVSWQTSIGYHLFMCVLALIVAIAFLLVRPFLHAILLIIIFGFLWSNVFAYVRSVFNLYFSNVHIGDRLKVNGVEGVLTGINLGGMHISSHNEKTFFPFEKWTSSELTLLSQAGRIPVTIVVTDTAGRSALDAVTTLEKTIFSFPYLCPDHVEIDQEHDQITAIAELEAEGYKSSYISRIEKQGFTIINK